MDRNETKANKTASTNVVVNTEVVNLLNSEQSIEEMNSVMGFDAEVDGDGKELVEKLGGVERVLVGKTKTSKRYV